MYKGAIMTINTADLMPQIRDSVYFNVLVGVNNVIRNLWRNLPRLNESYQEDRYMRYYSRVQSLIYDCYCYPALGSEEAYIINSLLQDLYMNIDLYNNFIYISSEYKNLENNILRLGRCYVDKITNRANATTRYIIERYMIYKLMSWCEYYRIYDTKKNKIVLNTLASQQEAELKLLFVEKIFKEDNK